MAVHAITPIRHGLADGEVKVYEVGDKLTEGDFTDAELQAFVDGGSAVEIGKDRKYSNSPEAGAAGFDESTRLRDELIAKSMSSGVADDPAAEDAVSSNASAAGEKDKTIGQVAADSAKGSAAGEGQ